MSLFKKRYSVPGSAPGILQAKGNDGAVPARVSVFDYDNESFTEEHDLSIEQCRKYFASPRTTWIHVQGDPPLALLELLGEAYTLHALALEDVLHTGQRPKLDRFGALMFVVLQLPVEAETGVVLEQVSLFLSESTIVSFHSGEAEFLEPVRLRLRTDPPRRLRGREADYLLYVLIDSVVDHLFPMLEVIGDELEELEVSILESPDTEALDRAHSLRRKLLTLRRTLWPQREVLDRLARDDDGPITADTRVFLRDCYDHTIQGMDLVESFREMAASLQDLYMSGLSQRMNETMKVLTVIATIFIPLSFIVGLYGMNFNPLISPWNMPELNLRYGYPLLLLLMTAIAGGMLYAFRRKGWI